MLITPRSFCFIDRANIGNARLAGLEKDLHLKGYNYNQVLSVFYVSYILFEIPSNMCCKWIGPGWFIPAISLGFGAASIATAFVHDLRAICGVRFVLGIFEAGMLPGIAYYLSRVSCPAARERNIVLTNGPVVPSIGTRFPSLALHRRLSPRRGFWRLAGLSHPQSGIVRFAEEMADDLRD